jgi:hypothetical protein
MSKISIAKTNATDTKLEYQCKCGTWLEKEYSWCETCEKKERMEWIKASVIVIFSLSVIVGLVMQFENEIVNFFTSISITIHDLFVASPPFIQGFVGTVLIAACILLLLLIWIDAASR